MFLSRSIADGFNIPMPGSLTILATIDFSKAFGHVRHPTSFHKIISIGLPPCFARWTQSFFTDRRTYVVLQNYKSRSFRVRRGVPQGSVLGPVLFFFFINDFLASLPSSVSCSLYADDMAIWSSSSVPTAVEATQGVVSSLHAYLITGVFSFRANVRPFSFQWISTKLTTGPIYFYSTLPSISIELSLGLPSTAVFSLLSMHHC